MLGSENSSAQSQAAQAGHARLVLNKTVTLFCTTLYMYGDAVNWLDEPVSMQGELSDLTCIDEAAGATRYKDF